MPVILDGGTNEVEDPILLPPNTLQASSGAEYRSGRQGIFRARGRDRLAQTSTTLTGSYHAGFDDGTDWAVVQQDTGYRFGRIDASGMALSPVEATAGMPVVGSHYGNRHYLVNEVDNLVAERDSAAGLTFRQIGMDPATQTIGLSITQGASQFSATTGLIYWLTEYDSTRGLESVAGATSLSTGVFSSLDSVVLTFSGSLANSNADKLRIYRTNDGGVFPDGGMLAEIDSTDTTYTDTYSNVSTLLVPGYGSLQIGELSFDRDEKPPPLSIVGSFSGGLVGFATNARRELRYTPAGYPESWPSIYAIPLETHRHDTGMAVAEYFGSLGVFTRDTVHRVTRLTREVDSVFAPSEAIVLVTDERGCVSRRGVATFSPPGSGPRLAFVARDGIWMTDLDRVIPLTDGVAWDSRVSVADLSSSVLINDPANRRLGFFYRKFGEEYNTGVMYLDYQGDCVRITHGDHGPIGSACLAPLSGKLVLLTTDSRDDDGSVYAEAIQDRDDSELVDSSGSVSFSIRTAEYMPAGTQKSDQVGTISWLHSDGTSAMAHYVFYDQFEHPELRTRDWSSREVDDVGFNRTVNSLSIQLASTSTTSFSVGFLDIEGMGSQPLGPSEGA